LGDDCRYLILYNNFRRMEREGPGLCRKLG
jgi:hypothetical protein